MVVMAHGNSRPPAIARTEAKTGIGSRRIFPPHFKLQVLDSYRSDADCKGNQRATARKYGIHRRQIQKWLQAEGNLRNSVKGRELEIKQEPLQQQQQQQEEPKRVPDTTWDAPIAAVFMKIDDCPIDLSMRKQRVVQLECPATPTTKTPEPQETYQTIKQDPDVWDLSTKPQKRKLETSQINDDTDKPPVKLFKPYLDDYPTSKPQTPPNNNNNNNLQYDPYTAYYYPYPYYEDIHHQHQLGSQYYYDQPMKQRQSYTLDFKLKTIDCYRSDDMCRGNQRAVASKYNIHRRQVQKWLKQEEELRHRSESLKQTHGVR